MPLHSNTCSSRPLPNVQSMMAVLNLCPILAAAEVPFGRQCSSAQQLTNLRASVIVSAASVNITERMNGASSAAFVRPHLKKLAAYTPIEPFEVLSKRLGRKPADIVKLDANENPYGPPEEVLQALGSMPFPNIYPDPETRQLRTALAQQLDVPMQQILVRQADQCFLHITAGIYRFVHCGREPVLMHCSGTHAGRLRR